MSEHVIDAHHLVVQYGQVVAVNGLTLQVPRGEVLGLLGGNGAGKSSTLRAFAGVNPPTAGQLTVAGHDLTDHRDAEKARAAVGYCPDVSGLMRQATVREHVAMALAFRNQTHLWPQALDLIETFGLTDQFDRPTAGFSHGMSRRLSVLLAALTATDVLLLDEPFDGVDPLGADATIDAVRTARDAGLAAVVSTHLIDVLVTVADRIVVMGAGRQVAQGPAHEFAGTVGRERYAALLREHGARA